MMEVRAKLALFTFYTHTMFEILMINTIFVIQTIKKNG